MSRRLKGMRVDIGDSDFGYGSNGRDIRSEICCGSERSLCMVTSFLAWFFDLLPFLCYIFSLCLQKVMPETVCKNYSRKM